MKKLMIAALAMLAFGAMDVTAQTNGAATVNIPTVLVVTNVSDLTIAETAFDFSGSNTSQASGSVTIDTRSNVLHAVDVSLNSPVANAGDVLTLKVLGADATWSDVTATAVKALDNLARGTQTGNTISFQTTADVSQHAPGTYSGTITYTVVANY